MTERSKRRAAERKARKRENKNQPKPPFAAAATAASAAQTQTLNGQSVDDQPPSRLDPAPERPVPGHLLDPFEESDVEVSEFYARRRERMLAEFAATQAVKNPVSDAQQAANKANAQHSTGPSSDAGKANSSRNNFRHGLTHTEGDLVLLPDESKDDYSRALAGFQREWQPHTESENDLVERLASRQWLRRRAMRLQMMYLAPNGQILDFQMHSLYRRYEATHERSYNRALNDLIRIRSLRLREKNGFESQQRKNKEHEYRIRSLENRQKLQELAIQIAEAKLSRLNPPPPPPKTEKSPNYPTPV